jgi:hypothetical protein
VNDTPELPRTAELLLVRLLPFGKTRPNPKKLREELEKFGAKLSSETAWSELVSELAKAGLVIERPLGLTDAGRDRAMKLLGLSELPPRATWAQIRDKHLVPLAAGGGPAKDHSGKDRLAALLLKRRYDLPLPRGAKLATAAIALVCKELGFPGLTDLKALEAAVLSRMLNSPDPLPLKNAIEQLVRVKLGAPRGKVDELRQAVVAQWVGQSEAAQHPPAKTSPDNLASFAVAVNDAARKSSAGWFGDNKLFISHAWRAYRATGNGQAGMDLAAFKHRLVEANTRGLLRLGRADLVAAMNEHDVRDSQIKYLNTEFHFLLVDGGTA